MAVLVALGTPQVSDIDNPRYICLNDIETFIEDPGNKSFCEQAGEAQCFDVYEASTGESAFLRTQSDSCDCYCQHFDSMSNYSKQVLKLNSSPEKAKFPKRSILTMNLMEYPWNFETPNGNEHAFCLSAADVRGYLSTLSNVNTVPRKLAAMAMPLSIATPMGNPLLSAQFLPNASEDLTNGWITEGPSMPTLMSGLQPSGSMAIFFTSTTRPNTYIVKGDHTGNVRTPFQPGATINSVEINTGSNRISTLQKCKAYLGLTVQAMFVAPDYYISGPDASNSTQCAPNFFFDIHACDLDPLLCQNADKVYKACTSCAEDIEDVKRPCNLYADTVCSQRPTLPYDPEPVTDAASLEKQTPILTAIVLSLVGVLILIGGANFIRRRIRHKMRNPQQRPRVAESLYKKTPTPQTTKQGLLNSDESPPNYNSMF